MVANRTHKEDRIQPMATGKPESESYVRVDRMRVRPLLALAAAFLAAVSGLAVRPTTATAAPLLDCPLRDAPFSIASPLIDVLLSPAASAAMERTAPGVLDRLPPLMRGTDAPSFAAIVTVRDAVQFVSGDASLADRIEPALRALPVLAADRRARCARYDTVRPRFRVAKGRPALLLFEKVNGFRDGPSLDAAHAMFVQIAQARGWQIVATDKAGIMNARDLARFDAVVWNNVSGDVLTLSQRRAFRDYVERGGGMLGVHGSAGDPATFWPWYTDQLIGARFAGHPMAPQFQPARIVVEDTNHPAARELPQAWTMTDEWYSFLASPRAPETRVIARLDESSYDPGKGFGRDLRMGDHPIAWSRTVGKGRMVYSAIGHLPEGYGEAHHVALIGNGLAWVMRREGSATRR